LGLLTFFYFYEANKPVMLLEFVNLLFPNRCRACERNLLKGEELLCTFCRYKLPKTNYHKLQDNPVVKHFWGRTNVSNATAYLYFHKGDRVQQLVHLLKYKGDKEIGILLGHMFGSELFENETYNCVDFLVPVPLHKSRQYSRGYNQSEMIATGLHDAMKIPVLNNLLLRERATETQTKKRRYNRYENMKEVFTIKNPELYKGRHFLLVDDVITTGSTLVACAEKLLKIEDAKVSIAALAYAHR
jgi:ComF family protein